MTPSKDKTTLSQKLHIRQIKVSMHEGQINQIILQALKLGKKKKKKKKKVQYLYCNAKIDAKKSNTGSILTIPLEYNETDQQI